MNIFDFALEKEMSSEQYYRDLASRTDNEGLRKILGMLAEEEVKHQKVIMAMKRETPEDLSDTLVLQNVKGVFEKMRNATTAFDFDNSELELYRKARDFEQQSMNFYIEKSKETQDRIQEAIFLKLANEEKKHLAVVQNICEFVETPECYLENAEFTHLEAY